MIQVNPRVSAELDAALTQWAVDDKLSRPELFRQILAEAVDARREGRATFSRPELPTPADLQHLTVKVSTLVTELNRVLVQNGKRDAELAKNAKIDAVGVSEARTAIVAQLTAEFHRTYDANQVGLDKIAAALVAEMTVSPTFSEIVPTLQRLEREPRFDVIDQRQLEQGALLKAHTAAIASWVRQPRQQISYSVWEEHWSGRRVGGVLLAAWVLSVIIFFVLATVLPRSWLAVRSANTLLGGGDQAVCALVNYRMATDGCRVEIDGQAMKVVVKAEPRSASRKR